MKTALLMSLGAHAGLLVAGLVSISSARKIEEPSISVPIDIVSIEEFTDLKRGTRKGEKKEEAVSAAPQAPEKPREAPPAPKTDEKAEAAPPPAVIEPVKPPEPKPEPVKEPPKEPEPAPPPPPPVKALEPPKPQPVPVKEPDPPKPPPPKEAQPKPERKPPPPKPPEQKPVEKTPTQDKGFDPDRIAALLNKTAPPKAAAPEPPKAATPSQGVPDAQGARLIANELDALRAKVEKCWTPPFGADDAQSLAVQLKIVLNPDGSVNGAPQVARAAIGPFAQVAAESAQRAVLRCQPYTISAATYEKLRGGFIFNFDPIEMFAR